MFVLIIFTYTLIVLGFLFYKDNEITDLQLEHSYVAFLEQAKERMDTKLQVANNVISQLSIDSELLEFGANATIDYYNVTKLYQMIRSDAAPFSQFGFRVAVTKPQEKIVITTAQSTDKQRYYQEIEFTEDHIRQVERFMEEPSSSSDLILLQGQEQAEQPFMTIVRKVRLTNGSTVVFFLTFETEYFLPVVQAGQDESFGIVQADGIVALNASQPSLYRLLDASLLQKIGQARFFDTSFSKLSLSGYTVRYVSSTMMPSWKYVYFTPNNSVRDRVSDILWRALPMYVLFAAAGILLTFFATNRAYVPIRELVAVFRGYEKQSPTKDDLQFVQETASRIRTDNERLRETLEQYTVPLRVKWLRDLLNGLAQAEGTQPDSSEYRTLISNEGSNVCFIEMVNYSEWVEAYSEEGISLIRAQIMESIASAFQEHMEYELLEWDYKRFVMIVKHSDVPEFRKVGSALFVQLEKQFNVRLAAAIGSVAPSLAHIHHSMKEAEYIMEQRFPLDQRPFLVIEDVSVLSKDQYYFPMDKEREIVDHIVRGKREPAMSALDYILERNLGKEDSPDSDAMKQLLLGLVTTVNRILQHVQQPSELQLGKGISLYQEFLKCSTKEELKQRVFDCFDQLLSLMSEEKEQLAHSQADRMVEFIREHYSKDISLADVAEHLNLSPGYVSTMFKQYTKENFKDYLNKHRIRVAKEILENDKNAKVNEVAFRVGCNNVYTFIRMFKKYEGTSPGAYAKNQE